MEISDDTARLFGAEVDNEDEGGVSPATLASALDSVQQGYDPRMFPGQEEWDADAVMAEIEALIKEHGEDTELESLEW
jgi:hypothetical protein